MNISLTKFCKDHGLAKTTVHRRTVELNMDLSDGLTPENADRLLHEFDVQQSEPESEAIATEPQPYRPTVEAGNHQIILASPELPETYSLEPLRTGEVVAFEDPLALAEQFIAAADAVQAAMDDDIQKRQQRLKQTKKAKETIASRVQELSLEARLYKLQTTQLDTDLSRESQDLSKTMQQLQTLGKPPSEDAA